MASDKGVVASGLDSETQATRRRNVPSTTTNGGMVNKVEADDKKTKAKKVRLSKFCEIINCAESGSSSCANMSFKTARAIVASISGRVGVSNCPFHLHRFGILHPDVQDWLVSDCDMGRSTVRALSSASSIFLLTIV
jgi:hypothetical protein